jgi:hypothetical protein
MASGAELTGIKIPGMHADVVNIYGAGAPPAPPASSAPLSLPLDTIPNVASLPPGSRMPLAPNPLFVGRDDDLRLLARTLSQGTTTAIAAATGLGGIGKTQLATSLSIATASSFRAGCSGLALPTRPPSQAR